MNQNKKIMNVTVQKMEDDDWPSVKNIYQEGIDTGNATFETVVPTWQEWDSSHLRDCRLIAKFAGQIVGWIALSPVSNRCAYQGVAEVSLYVKSSAREQGVGKALITSMRGPDSATILLVVGRRYALQDVYSQDLVQDSDFFSASYYGVGLSLDGSTVTR